MPKFCSTTDLFDFSHHPYPQPGYLPCFLARVELTSFVTIVMVLNYQFILLTLLRSQTKNPIFVIY